MVNNYTDNSEKLRSGLTVDIFRLILRSIIDTNARTCVGIDGNIQRCVSLSNGEQHVIEWTETDANL